MLQSPCSSWIQCLFRHGACSYKNIATKHNPFPPYDIPSVPHCQYTLSSYNYYLSLSRPPQHHRQLDQPIPSIPDLHVKASHRFTKSPPPPLKPTPIPIPMLNPISINPRIRRKRIPPLPRINPLRRTHAKRLLHDLGARPSSRTRALIQQSLQLLALHFLFC